MGPPDGAAAGPPLVLVADHVAERRRAYVASLAAGGYRVDEAATALEALEKARQLLPTVVVLELAMPSNGCELTQALKATADVCVVALVSPSESTKKHQAEQLGADVCVLKPCPPTALLEYVRTCVAGYGRR